MPTVHIEPHGWDAYLREGEPILTGLFRCGFTVRKLGCRRGGCGICKLDLVTGEVTYEKIVADEVLSGEEKADGKCLTCRAIPVGDVTLHVDDGEISAAPAGLMRFLNTSSPAAPPAPSMQGKDN